MNKTILALALCAVAVPAMADEETVWLTTGMWSRHNAEAQHHYRQNNSGVGFQVDETRNLSVAFGQYQNSLNQPTTYGGITYAPLHIGNGKIGFMTVLATGYTDKVPAVPLLSLYGTYEYKRVGVNVFWLPSVVVAVQLKFKLEGK